MHLQFHLHPCLSENQVILLVSFQSNRFTVSYLSSALYTWLKFGTTSQLSKIFLIPSLSESSLQASPEPSPSVSSWPEFGIVGQLSSTHLRLVQLPEEQVISGQPSRSVSIQQWVPSPAKPVEQPFGGTAKHRGRKIVVLIIQGLDSFIL